MLESKLLTTTAVALSLTLGTAASIATAQEATGMMGSHGGMMRGHKRMMGNNDGMMGMTKGVDPAQMTRMVENCNRMMESMAQNMPSAPTAPATPEPEKKG